MRRLGRGVRGSAGWGHEARLASVTATAPIPTMTPAPPLPASRCCLLHKAFSADWKDAVPVAPPNPPPARGTGGAAPEGGSPLEWVRPARFMACLNAVQAEMLSPGAAAGGWADAAAARAAGRTAPASDGVLERLEAVRHEALGVLARLAGEGDDGYMP